MTAELVHATLAFLTTVMETENHPYAPLARRVITEAGPPTPVGMQAVFDRQAELNAYADWLQK